MKLVISVVCVLVAAALAEYASVNDIIEQFDRYAKKTQTPEDVEVFDKIIKLLALPSHIHRTSFEQYSQPRQALTCMLCRTLSWMGIKLRRVGTTEAVIAKTISNFCVLLRMGTSDVCNGVIKLNLPIILYVVDNYPGVDGNTFCGLAFQSTSSKECPLNDARFEYSIKIPERTGNVVNHISENRKIKIVHLSDAHIDPNYEAFGVANCKEPTCCRQGQSKGKGYDYEIINDEEHIGKSIVVTDSELMLDLKYADEVALQRDESRRRWMIYEDNKNHEAAGYWGDYRNCDTPIWAFNDIVEHAAENNADAEFVYYTGDNVDHGVWETSRELCKNSTNVVINKIADSFPNIPIYSIIGNHESQPVNQYAPESVSDTNYTTKWLYDFLAEKWSPWLPEDALETVRKGGYYTVVPKPGFRVIALNSNVANRHNWWLVFDPVDPSGQLQWFADTLFKAEQSGELVHILTHIPSGTRDVYKTWSREYRRIYERFSHIIAAEFNGHTHNDEFKMYYNRNNTSIASSVSWNGGAATSYSTFNVNYKVFTIDANTYEPLDIDTFIYNMTEANLTPQQRPRWYKLYSFKDAYGLESLKPQVLHNLVHRMASKEERYLLRKYVRYWGKEGDLYLSRECDSDCEKKHLCKIVTTELWDDAKCKEIESIYDHGSA